MYQLFTKRFEANNSIIRPGAFELLRRIYQREIFNIVSYYNDRVYAVKSNHLLCRVLNTVGVPLQYELDRYTEASVARSPYVAKHFNFTSEINYGKFHEGVFYGEGSKELIISNDIYYNPYEEYSRWKQIRAVEFLDHDISNLSLLLPDGHTSNSETGLAVISINLPLLLLQYRGFVLEQAAKISSGESVRLGVTHFVHMYVLPNMLQSHIEIAIFNRLNNLYTGAPMGESYKSHPFFISDYSNKVDSVLKIILKHIKDSGMLYYSMLKNIPSLFNEDGQVNFMMPDMAKTRQCWWALYLTRLKMEKFLIDCGGDRTAGNNGMYLNKLKIDTKRLLDENIMQSVLYKDMYFDTNEIMTSILKI